MRIRSLILALVAVLAASGVAVANDDPDFVRARLFRDGSVSCTGADDTSRRGGHVLALAHPGKVFFTVKLRNAEPNKAYTLAVSEEPNCANPQFFGPRTTDADGDTTFRGTYDTTPGEKNLLFNVSTTNPQDPRNREIATRNARIVVPS